MRQREGRWHDEADKDEALEHNSALRRPERLKGSRAMKPELD
jgi:hypothetical protein